MTSTLDRPVPAGETTPTGWPGSIPTRTRPPRRPWWRRPEGDPAWARPALLALLTATALLYLWGLGASGWANSFYSAAVQAMTKSWKAFFFGSSDAGNSITVDKTPGSLWPMAISARLFGVNAWSILVPQALEGVATVALLYLTVKRWFGPAAGLLAGAVSALIPVAVLMFRFNNPDSLLVMMLVLGAYAVTRAVEDGRTRWMVLAGAAVGFGFLAKELQAFVILPVFAGTYLLAGPPRLATRIRQLVVMGVSTLVAGGWWVAIVSVWPASSRPYIGGSQNNSFWNVLFGYNGFGRLTGEEAGSVGGRGQGGGRWGPTGWFRMFNDQFGAQASWLIPAALLVLVAGLLFTVRRPRTDRTRAALVLWGGWLVLTGLVFSLSQGIIHEYYTVALAPAIGALAGGGGAHLWQRRHDLVARNLLAIGVALSTGWSYVLLARDPDWHAELRWLSLGGGVAAVLVLVVWPREIRRYAPWVAAGTLLVSVLGATGYSLATAATPHGGALPTAGPAGSRFGGPGGMPGGAGNAAGNRSRPGGLLDASNPSDELTAVLDEDASRYTWVAATVGANEAAGYQLATGEPVMPIGGFNGSDPSPTLEQFQRWVDEGKIHYFVVGGRGLGGLGGIPGFGGAGGFGGVPGFGGGPGAPGGPGGGRAGSEISQWVAQNFEATTVDGVTLYDLTSSGNG